MEENFFRNFNELTFFYYMLLGDRSDSTSRYVNYNVKNSPKFLNNLNIFHIVELHLFLGVGNKIFKTLDDKMKEKKYLKQVPMTAYEWAHQSPRCITREKFFGGDLNGPMLNSLLHHADALHDFLPDDLKKFAQALNALDALKKACFSLTVLPAWERKHEEFVMAWHRCGIPRTPKFHIIEVRLNCQLFVYHIEFFGQLKYAIDQCQLFVYPSFVYNLLSRSP